MRNVVLQLLDLQKQSRSLKVGNYLLSCLKAVKPLIFSAVFVYFSVTVKDDYLFKIVSDRPQSRSGRGTA